MSDNFILDLVNKVFLDYTSLYSIEQSEDSEEKITKEKKHEEKVNSHEDVPAEDKSEEKEQKEQPAEETNSIVSNSGIDELDIQRRLLINLPFQSDWLNTEQRKDITEGLRPIDSRLESHIFEFGNRFIGADYPTIEQRQLYSALNPSTYSMVHSDFIFGEHHKTNVYTDNKPVYTAMRSEKVNILPDSHRPAYMRKG